MATINRKFNYDELSLFCFELSLMLKSGMPLLEGIEMLSDEVNHPNFKKIVSDLQTDLTAGENFFSSLSKHSEFPDYMISIVKIAELSGNLDTEMEKLSLHYEKLSNINTRVAKAVTYPAILAAMMLVVITILIVKVIPIFRDILISIGGDIPPVTGVLFSVSSFITGNILIIGVVLAAIIIGSYLYFKSPNGKSAWKKWLTESFMTKDLYQKLLAVRFAQSMSLMLRSGITYEEALVYVADVLDNKYAKEKLFASMEKLKGSYNIVTLLEDTALMPVLFIKMLKIGMQTGETEKVFDKLADIYDLQVDKAINRFTSVIEPLLIGTLSTVVGIILISVILPIINIISSMG